MKETHKVEVVASVVVVRDGKLLMVQEKGGTVRGLWNIPGGRVDQGETLAEAAVREAKEETGYDVELIKELTLWHGDHTVPVLHAFEAKIIGGELSIDPNEVLDVKWIPLGKVEMLKRRNPIYIDAALSKI